VPLREPRIKGGSDSGKGQLIEWWTLFSELSGVDTSFSLPPSSTNPKNPASDSQIYLSSLRSPARPTSLAMEGVSMPLSAGGPMSATGGVPMGGGAGSGVGGRQVVGVPRRSVGTVGVGGGQVIQGMSPQEAWSEFPPPLLLLLLLSDWNPV
jgi:hypothetical protein